MANLTDEIKLLFRTSIDDKDLKEVSQNLKNALGNAAIGFDEAEIKRNVEPIIRMVQKLFNKADIKFNADELLAMPGRQALQKMSEMGVDQLQIAFDRALQKSGGIKIDFGDIDLSSMTEPLEKLTQELSEIGERVASTTKKSVQDIEKSLKSLDKAKKLDKTVGGIEKTLGTVNSGKSITSATKATTQLEKAREAYSKSVTDNDPWEVQYQHLLTFVSRYEAMAKKIKPIIDTNHPEFKQLYELLSPKAGAAKISLEHFVDIARGNELSEYKNQPWARESTLKKVERALSNGITVKDGGNKDDISSKDAPSPTSPAVDSADGKKLNTKVPNSEVVYDAEKINAEADIQNQRIIFQKIEETKKQIEENDKRITEIKKDIAAHASFKAYKGIGADSADELEDRAAVYEAYGGDYYTSDLKAAMSYATDEESNIVVAEIKPRDPLTFDAKKYSESGDYAEVIYSPDFLADFKARLKEKYEKTASSKKTLQKKYDAVDAFTSADKESDEAQRLMNEMAYDAGFDSVIFDNVLDYASNAVESIADGEGASVKRKTAKTIAVLKDEILKIIGFHKVEETESGQNISKELLTEIPDYYHMPTQETDDGDFVPQAIAEISDDLREKIDLESQVADIEKQNKKLQKELDSLQTEVKNIDTSNDKVESSNDVRKDEKPTVNDAPTKDGAQIAESQQIEKEAESHKNNTAAIKEEIKATEELAAAKAKTSNVSDSSEEIKELKKIISIQKQWLEYLDNILNDDKFKTNGKRAATEQLSRATKALVDYRRHPDEYAGEEMRGDKLVVMWNKAYEEAKKQGVAQSTLTRNYTDAVDMYADALERLQAQQRFSLQTIAEKEAKINALQQPAQDDTAIHQDNTVAIVAETQATKELNEEKSKSLLPTADGLEAHTYAPSDEQKAYVLKLGEEYRAIMEILERGDSEFELALIERAKSIRKIMFDTVRGSDGFLGHQYEESYGGSHKTATYLENWQQADRLLPGVDSNKIDDSQRQAAIDLIYQELEAEKQLEETRRKAREAAKQREIDTFKSKYLSASEEEKKLLYELIELEKEHRTLSDMGDEESCRLALETLQRAREKYIALEKLNEDLLDAYDDVGFKRAEPYVNAPRATVQEVDATPVDTSAEQTQLTSLKGSVDDVTGAVNAKTQAFKDEGVEVGKVVDGEIEKLGTLETKISTIKETLESLLSNIKNGADDVGTGLNNITVNVNHKKEEDGESTVSINQDSLKSTLEQIVYKVKIAHDNNDKQANKIAIDEGILENVLKRVTYNVNLANDDEKNGKQIVPDKDTSDPLGDDPQEDNKQWQSEVSTLLTRIKVHTHNTVRQLRDNVVPKMADVKAKSIEVTPAKVEVGNVLATENTLVAIKTAVEAINSKIVKGTKAKTSDGGKKQTGNQKRTGVGKKNAEDYAGSQYFPEKLKTQAMYLAKFRAQLMTTGKLTDDVDAQIYELLDALSQVKNGPDFSRWNQQFLQLKTSVGIADIFEDAEDKEVAASYKEIIELQKLRNKLELDYEKAEDGSAVKQFYADQLAQMDQAITKQQIILDNEEYEMKLVKIRTEQARKLGELEAKAADRDAKMRAEQERKLIDEKSKQSEKDAKKQAANAKRMAQREAMLGKAGNAVGRAENTWMSAAGIEGELPADFVAEIDNYYQKLDELRKKHQELKNSDMISDEQKNELIAQTMSVNKMTEEIGALVAEYQKLSGDNATVIGTNTLNSDAGLGAYEQQLKQAVTTATNGKAQIKNFDAATKTLTYTVKTGKNEFTEYTAAVRRLDGQLVSVQGTTKRTETFFEATARKMKELTSYFSGMAVFNQIGQELRRGIQYVKEIDLALTELKKVTDETEETYDRFLETAAKTADKVGSTIQKVVSSTADWARLGYSMKEAAEFAESTQILMNVSEFTDVSQATDTLISAVQAFGYTAETSMNVVDLLNTIGKQNCRNYIVIYS